MGEIFLCLISINSPTRFARRGIIKQNVDLDKFELLSTSERLAALLRAASHLGWCVFGVILSGWDIEGKVNILLYEMPVYNTKCLISWRTLGTSDQSTC